MALAARFRELDGSLSDFLFASIGEEENGMDSALRLRWPGWKRHRGPKRSDWLSCRERRQ